jgi:multiple sugar transport system permease protein
MTTTSIDAPVGAQTTSRGNGRRPQPGSGHHILAYLFLGVLVVYFFIPIWWLFVASTKDAAGLFNGSNGALWFDSTFALVSNLKELFTYNEGIYLRWVANSLFYAIAGGAGATVLCVLAGYGFAKFRFRGRRVMLAVLLGSVMVPLTALVIPTFILFSNLHLTDTVWAVILPSLLNPFGVYLMQVYTAVAVPDELLDAARVDGAGEIKTFFRVALPLLRPAVVTVLLLSIVGVWNNFFLPLAMLANTKLFPITVGLAVWQGQASGNNTGGANLWGIIIIGALVSVIPLIIAFLALQKYWQGGLSLGALK